MNRHGLAWLVVTASVTDGSSGAPLNRILPNRSAMPAPAITIHTYADKASSFDLWGEYVDPDGTFSEEEFEAMSFEHRIALMVETYGPEPTDAEISEDISFASF